MAPVFAYHERTKHYPGRYARAPAAMDWATQPDPFRRFEGAPQLPLALIPGRRGIESPQSSRRCHSGQHRTTQRRITDREQITL